MSRHWQKDLVLLSCCHCIVNILSSYMYLFILKYKDLTKMLLKRKV